MKQIIPFFIAVALFSSCGNSNKDTTSNNKSGVDSLSFSEKSSADNIPASFYKRFKGTLGQDIRISMELIRVSADGMQDSVLSGSYYYVKVGKPLILSGKVNRDGNIRLTERDEMWEETGSFEGRIDGKGDFTGTWTGTKNKKTFPFKLSEIKEGFAGIDFKKIKRENCKVAEENKKSINEGTNWIDTTCMSIEVDLTIVKDCPNADLVNDRIKKYILGEKSNYKSIEEYVNAVDTFKMEDFIQAYTNVGIETNENNVLGMYVAYEEYTGGAHPNHAVTHINFDLGTGNEITLDELFVPGYTQKLNKIAEKLFVAENGTEGWDFEPGKFQLNKNFSLTTGGIGFFFNPYEIGPYAMGSPEVFIPYGKIKDLIKPGSVIFRLWTAK